MATNKNPNSFGKKFRNARKRAGFTQEDIVEELAKKGFPMPQSRLSHYETGRNNPDPDVMAAMAEVVGVSVDYLTGRTTTQAPVAEIEEALAAATGAGRINRIMDKLPKEKQQQILTFAEYLLAMGEGKKPITTVEEWLSATEVLIQRFGSEGEMSLLDFILTERPNLATKLGIPPKQKLVKKG